MKTISILIALAATSFAQTAEIDALTARRNEAVARIDATYKTELEKLKAKYMAAGNLEAASAASRLAGGATVSTLSDKSSVTPKLDGKWMVNDKGVRTFKGNILTHESGLNATWTYKDGVILIQYTPTVWEKLTYDPSEPSVLKGVNQTGFPHTYKRISGIAGSNGR